MGASGWDYIESYDGDPGLALARLRERVLNAQDYYWDDEYLGPRPTSLSELDATREEEEFWEVGTHSILDMDRVVPAASEDHDGTVRVLPGAESISVFGTDRPTRVQFEARKRDLPVNRAWSGYYQLLYQDGAASEIAFWGFSGD